MRIEYIYKYISYNGYQTGRMNNTRTVDLRKIKDKYSRVSNPYGLIHPFREITYQHASYWVNLLSTWVMFDYKYEEPFFITDDVAPIIYRVFLQAFKNIFEYLRGFLEDKVYYYVDYEYFKNEYVPIFDEFVERLKASNKWLNDNTGKKYKLPGFNLALLKNPSLQYSAPRRTRRWDIRGLPQFQSYQYDNKTLGPVRYLDED